ncbi:MAG: hypothetical protein HYV97_14290 [Bdellovibrio sp.]|nr:hypothetical protein [Bdellovibrio sp.]
MSYLVGGQYLSIIKDDLDGASYLYRKAMEKYPNDYSINYHAGFHFLYEAKDLTQAKIAYTRLSTVPDIQKKFPLLPKILARIDADSSGDDENALKILTQAYLELPDKHPLKNAYLKAIKKRGGQIPLNNH